MWSIVDVDDTILAEYDTEEEARNSLYRYGTHGEGLEVKYLEDEDEE